jgi:cytochrome c
MDAFELNKIAGITLGTLLFALGLGYFADAAFYRPAPANPGWTPPGLDHAAAPAAGAKKEEVKDAPIAERLAAADAAKGEAVFKKLCASCHTADQGGANKTGPNLYGVVARKIAGHEGFSYSDALKKHGGDWSYDNLDHWVANPKEFASGNKMTFAGDKNAASRADLIAWLRAQSASPAPLPGK